MTSATEDTTEPQVPGERADLQASIDEVRWFLAHTLDGLTDDQARERSTVSELTLGGIVKHVTQVEHHWSDMIAGAFDPSIPRPKDFVDFTEEDWVERAQAFVFGPEDTIDGVLADYREAAARNTELLAGVASLDVLVELPKAPWNRDTHWSVRRIFQHSIAETAQHAGHADIIREAIDGRKSMG